MTKAELIDAIAEKLLLKKKDVVPVVEEVFASIEGALSRGEKCTFVGFGVFEVKERAAREGRNPQDPTKVVKIPAKKVPVFRPGKDLKEKVLAIKGKKKAAVRAAFFLLFSDAQPPAQSGHAVPAVRKVQKQCSNSSP